MECDVLVAGSGVAGLLVAGALASHCRVVVVEQEQSVPTNKYWLTDARATEAVQALAAHVQCEYGALHFLAYDETEAVVPGRFLLWDTDSLTARLLRDAVERGARVLTGHRFYAMRYESQRLRARVGREVISTRLLVDCMGYASPLVTAKQTVSLQGFYLLHGMTMRLLRPLPAIGLHNVMLQRHPTYLEVFPVGDGQAHVTLIAPSSTSTARRTVSAEFKRVVASTHYADHLQATGRGKALYGVIPVGRPLRRALHRVFFFGESGQVHPAASATGLSRMLATYRAVAAHLLRCLGDDSLDARSLARGAPSYVSSMNRLFQESLFDSILRFTSDDFRDLILDMRAQDPGVVEPLIFGVLSFDAPMLARLLTRRSHILRWHIVRALRRYLS